MAPWIALDSIQFHFISFHSIQLDSIRFDWLGLIVAVRVYLQWCINYWQSALGQMLQLPAVLLPLFKLFFFFFPSIFQFFNCHNGKSARTLPISDRKGWKSLWKMCVKAEKRWVGWVVGLAALKAIGIVWPTAYLHIYRIYYWHCALGNFHSRVANSWVIKFGVMGKMGTGWLFIGSSTRKLGNILFIWLARDRKDQSILWISSCIWASSSSSSSFALFDAKCDFIYWPRWAEQRHCNKVISISIAIQMPATCWKAANAAQVAGEDAAQMSLSVRLILMQFTCCCNVVHGGAGWWFRVVQGGGGDVLPLDKSKSINMQPASHKFQSNAQQNDEQKTHATSWPCHQTFHLAPANALSPLLARFIQFANLFTTAGLRFFWNSLTNFKVISWLLFTINLHNTTHLKVKTKILFKYQRFHSLLNRPEHLLGFALRKCACTWFARRRVQRLPWLINSNETAFIVATCFNQRCASEKLMSAWKSAASSSGCKIASIASTCGPSWRNLGLPILKLLLLLLRLLLLLLLVISFN